MSPVNSFSLLAFASAALAVPFNHHNHQHLHAARGAPGTYGESSAPVDPASSSPPYPFSSSDGAPVASSSGFQYPYPSGSGAFGTGWGWGTGYPRPTGYLSLSSSAPVAPASASSCSAYHTTCIWRSGKTSVSTIYMTSTIDVTPTPAAASQDGPTAACTPDVTVTHRVTNTITVTAGADGAASSYAPPPAASSYAAASAAPQKDAAPGGWGAPAGSSAAPVTPSSAAAPVTPSSAAAPMPDGSSAPSYSASAGSSAAAPSSSQPTASTGGGFSSKRGLAYNDATLCAPFAGSAGWAFNWVSNPAGSPGVPFIPELHNTESTFTSVWSSDAQSAIDSGAQYLFGFNEPDIPSQANLSPAAAASAWQQYMEPFAGKAKLVAPAVSNSGSPGEGIDWLRQFMQACSGCTIDAVNAHWYDSTGNDLSLFQSQIGAIASEFGLPTFVGEFGFIGSDSDISSALTQAMSWMDGQDSIVGYAYYMVADGFLNSGSSPSPYGLTYLA